MTEIDKITASVISSQVTLNLLESIKHTRYFNRELKRKLNLVYPELIKSERDHYDMFFQVKDEATEQVYQVFENFIKKISGVAIYDMANISFMIDAHDKDPKSLNGICNKILK